MRSLLFVPADSERKLNRGADAGADALVLDLEDSVLPERKPAAREMLAQYLHSYSANSQIWVRINDLTSGELLKDLVAVVPLSPKGIVLPKIRGPEDLAVVEHYLDMAEAMHGIAAGSIAMLAVCTETPSAVLRMADLIADRRPRLRGLIWGAEDLSSAMGAGDPRLPDGTWRAPYEHARVQCLLACHALDVEAIDTVYVDFKDLAGCRRNSEAARFDGFTGKVAIHPDQVAVINAAFTPSAQEIAYAKQVVAAFESGVGAVSLDGKMLDIPHLKAAKRTLSSAYESPPPPREPNDTGTQV
jgi:citrate lyase subunit beta / citryl-CoA lyase